MCEDCDSTGGSDTSMFRLEECPENANVSCFRSIVNFGTHTSKSNGLAIRFTAVQQNFPTCWHFLCQQLIPSEFFNNNLYDSARERCSTSIEGWIVSGHHRIRDSSDIVEEGINTPVFAQPYFLPKWQKFLIMVFRVCPHAWLIFNNNMWTGGSTVSNNTLRAYARVFHFSAVLGRLVFRVCPHAWLIFNNNMWTGGSKAASSSYFPSV